MSESKRKPINWEEVERDYRAGILSIREIGRRHDVTDKAIRNKAKAQGWQQDLSARVAEKVRSDLVRSEVRSEATADKQTQREIVEHAAATVVQVIRSHRVRIKQGNALVELLTQQLTDVAGKRNDFEAQIEVETSSDKTVDRYNRLMKAVSLGTHATIAVNLANATKTWVTLERQAFGLKDDAEDSKAPMDQAAMDLRIADLSSRNQ